MYNRRNLKGLHNTITDSRVQHLQDKEIVQQMKAKHLDIDKKIKYLLKR